MISKMLLEDYIFLVSFYFAVVDQEIKTVEYLLRLGHHQNGSLQ